MLGEDECHSHEGLVEVALWQKDAVNEVIPVHKDLLSDGEASLRERERKSGRQTAHTADNV